MADTADIRNTSRPRRSRRGSVPSDVRAVAERLQTAQTAYQRADAARASEHATILRHIKKTGWLVVGCALFIAAVADLLSIVDTGWVVSWIIPIISWFMVRRINSIMKSSALIAKATNRISREVVLARQRVMQILPPAERGRVAVSEHVSAVSEQAKNYVRTWIRDTVITQLIELIPLVDMLPLYLGQVVKMIVNQNIEYQKVRKLMPAYERALTRVGELERMEIEQLERLIVILLTDRAAPQQRVTDVGEYTPEQSRLRVAPGSERTVRDIQPAAEPFPAQQRSRIAPGSAPALRDITPAAALPVAA